MVLSHRGLSLFLPESNIQYFCLCLKGDVYLIFIWHGQGDIANMKDPRCVLWIVLPILFPQNDHISIEPPLGGRWECDLPLRWGNWWSEMSHVLKMTQLRRAGTKLWIQACLVPELGWNDHVSFRQTAALSLNQRGITEPNIRILILKISGVCKDWVDGTYHTHGNDLGGFSCPQAPKEKQWRELTKFGCIYWYTVFKSRQLRVPLWRKVTKRCRSSVIGNMVENNWYCCRLRRPKPSHI